MKCRSCGCTDQSSCEGGCIWVAPGLCSSCVPYDMEYRCNSCGYEFQVTVNNDGSAHIPGVGPLEAPDQIACPECGSKDVEEAERGENQ